MIYYHFPVLSNTINALIARARDGDGAARAALIYERNLIRRALGL